MMTPVAELPVCRNKQCPCYQSNRRVTLASEADDNWIFICDACKGIEYRTKPVGWKRATMENSYRRNGRPEYARQKATFDLGRRH